MNTPLKYFKAIALTEGWSYLVLLGIAMPLKYGAGFLWPVKYVGWLHGVLFVAYGASLLGVWFSEKWPFLRVLLAFIVSLVPFGTFWFDKKYLRSSGGK
jgi:integral membrane protein